MKNILIFKILIYSLKNFLKVKLKNNIFVTRNIVINTSP